MDKDVVDITGLMVKPKPGWEVRVAQLAKPEWFEVSILPDQELLDQLSQDEVIRLGKKLEMVRAFATYMAAGMLKGTIKYTSDNYHLKQWMAHLIGEGADQVNYMVLLFDAWQKEQRGENS